MLFPYQCNCLCWKIAITRLHWILLCWMWQVALAWHWESDHHGAPSCHWDFCVPSENNVIHWGFCSTKVEKKLCIAILTAIVLAHRSLIKTESGTAKLRQVDSHCWGLTGKWTSEWMSQSLLFCFSPVCPFLILSFQVVCSWEKILQHDLACCLSMLPVKFQGTWMVPSSYLFLRKQTSERKTQTKFQYFVYLLEICLNIFANQCKEESPSTPFFAKHTYLLELHLELNSGSSFHLYRSLSLF